MVECWLPYGKTEVHISVSLRNLLGTVEPEKPRVMTNPRNVFLEALQDPIGSPRIDELLSSEMKCLIAVDGTLQHSIARPIFSTLVEFLCNSGVNSEDITIQIGNGIRERADPELIEVIKTIKELKDVKLTEHSCYSGSIKELGKTTLATNVEISDALTEADFLVVIGEVLPDHISGFKGAHTTLLPQLSSLKTIEQNRFLSFKDDSSFGISQGNPVFEDIMEAVSMIPIDVAINVVPEPHKGLRGAYVGELKESLHKAIESLSDSYRLKAESNSDIIVVSAGGRKFDFDLYNSVWALQSAASIAKDGSSIILLAECSGGLGAPGLDQLAQVGNLGELKRRYMLGAKAVHLIKSIARKNEIVLVSALPNYLAEPLGFTVERTANDALESIVSKRRRKKTLVVTHGCSTVPFVH
jgi:nickel-dependent lactate racemase